MTRKEFIEDVFAHIIATVITLGFFGTVMIALLGYVDLKDATISNITGIIMGYVAGSLNTVLSRYFRTLPDESQDSKTGK